MGRPSTKTTLSQVDRGNRTRLSFGVFQEPEPSAAPPKIKAPGADEDVKSPVVIKRSGAPEVLVDRAHPSLARGHIQGGVRARGVGLDCTARPVAAHAEDPARGHLRDEGRLAPDP